MVEWQEKFYTQLSDHGLLTEETFPGVVEANLLGSPNVKTVTRFFVGALSHLTDNNDVLAKTAKTLFESNPSFVPIKDWMQKNLDEHLQLQRNASIFAFVKSHSMKWISEDHMKAWRVNMRDKLLRSIKARGLFQEDTTFSFASFPFLQDKEHEARLEYTIAALILKADSGKDFSERNRTFFGFTKENGEEELQFFIGTLDEELVCEIPDSQLFPISDLIMLSSNIVEQYHDTMES
jgi:hypothetical protein